MAQFKESVQDSVPTISSENQLSNTPSPEDSSSSTFGLGTAACGGTCLIPDYCDFKRQCLNPDPEATADIFFKYP